MFHLKDPLKETSVFTEVCLCKKLHKVLGFNAETQSLSKMEVFIQMATSFLLSVLI